jgi:hypothetical protein
MLQERFGDVGAAIKEIYHKHFHLTANLLLILKRKQAMPG